MQENEISALQKISFEGKGEAFVESKFLTPLLELLGYDKHQDYEVRRHGDDDTSFRLKIPAVHHGTKKLSNFNPDYIPTIRKKCFWIIEAKSPKATSYPFDESEIIQGAQYCLHPEIQAQYLIISNGKDTAIYDIDTSVYFEEDLYTPIYHFSHSDILNQWGKIFSLLSTEKVREIVEEKVCLTYKKLIECTLDHTYPTKLASRLTQLSKDASKKIKDEVENRRYLLRENRFSEFQKYMEKIDTKELLNLMDYQPGRGKVASEHLVERLIESDSPENIFTLLTHGYERQMIFRKEQIFIGLCRLHKLTEESSVTEKIDKFFSAQVNIELPLLNQAECAGMRVIKKLGIIGFLPKIKERISKYLDGANEIIRFVEKPNTLDELNPFLQLARFKIWGEIVNYEDDKLKAYTSSVREMDNKIDGDFKEAYRNLDGEEKEMLGWEQYGNVSQHFAFPNIIKNFLGQTYYNVLISGIPNEPR